MKVNNISDNFSRIANGFPYRIKQWKQYLIIHEYFSYTNNKKIVNIVFVFICCIAMMNAICSTSIKSNKPYYTSFCLWEAKDGILYRIPGIVSTKTGALIAYCEERNRIRDDWSAINIVYKKSIDGGYTWSDRKVLAGDLDNNTSLNNPVMIADSNGILHCIYEVMYGVGEMGGVFYTFSNDDGDTWSQAIDITNVTNPNIRNAIATGPGHGIELNNGTLLIPVWMVLKEYNQPLKSHKPAVVSTLYSVDYGKSWAMGEILYPNANIADPSESTLVELSDGRVMINSRNHSTKKYRAIAFSDTGYSGWSQFKYDNELLDPSCFGSLLRYDKNTILFVNNKSTLSRDNITLSISIDDGVTWKDGKIVQNISGGYADMCVGNDRNIYVLSEQFTLGEDIYSINLHKFNMEWLINKSEE